jgi:hypothetical protein
VISSCTAVASHNADLSVQKSPIVFTCTQKSWTFQIYSWRRIDVINLFGCSEHSVVAFTSAAYLMCFLPVDLSSALTTYIRYTTRNTEADTVELMFVKVIVVRLLQTFTYFSYIHVVWTVVTGECKMYFMCFMLNWFYKTLALFSVQLCYYCLVLIIVFFVMVFVIYW